MGKLRRKTSGVEDIFRESDGKPSENTDKPTEEGITDQQARHQNWTHYERTWRRSEKKTQKSYSPQWNISWIMEDKSFRQQTSLIMQRCVFSKYNREMKERL